MCHHRSSGGGFVPIDARCGLDRRSLLVERNPLICVVGVPNHTTYADFCQLCGPFIQNMLEMGIVRIGGSLQCEETCRMFFTVDIQYTGSIEHSQPSSASFTELPTCPVCLGTVFRTSFNGFVNDWLTSEAIDSDYGLHHFLMAAERLDQDTDGILTTICNHSFHCSRMSKWTDSSCPVGANVPTVKLYAGTASNSLKNQYREGHAIGHWKETEHCYSLELETQRVWDYAGDNYVHRLIQSKTDGKLVELNHHCARHYDGSSKSAGQKDTLGDEVEYYFESLLQEVEDDTERESSLAIEKALSENTKLLKLQKKLDKGIEQKRFLDEINDNLLRNQSIWESKIEETERSLHHFLRNFVRPRNW
ncbi:hypothetical protein SASPL_156662 [Salvia splendens]|uniref:UBP-type domain-containing protein n=1 Tax=Salvia splendens TaxID=180675 RepID=A0A8X8VWF5_SALSN|nr:hypothetical protein SASPL_156662 [Salvia splendens]